MRVATQVAWQVVDGEAIIVDLASGKTIGLNPTATYLWSQLDGRTAQQLIDDLVAQFDVSRGDAEGDVDTFLRLLRERNLISES